MKPEPGHDQIWSLTGELLWDIILFLDGKALLVLGTTASYVLLTCERAKLQRCLLQVKAPVKRPAGSKLRLSDDGHVSRRLCPPPRQRYVRNFLPVQQSLAKLARFSKEGDRLALGSLLPWLENGDACTRAAAVRAVSRVARREDRDVLASLLACLRDSSFGGAAMAEMGPALRCLVAPGDPEVVDHITGLLSNAAFAVRHAALQALPHVVAKGDAHAIDTILARADDKDVEIREEAIRALAQVASEDDHRALNYLIRGLRDESIYVRRAALEVLPLSA
ncbi:hypothetical protein AK812_SmicGene7676 [Symbiodinium microadriaticum]|uniref:HEAT repeat domain-containing protein n=2 Tax=Symbiodinium TaxID=2949 RepID=A0A1Q9EMY0_SYMMI|nr:hypothetical protein AK812_SmicGene7676 [Symbiodinium microadriaticum]